MLNSLILDTTKKLIGIDPTIDVYDFDILSAINMSIANLRQIGAGPVEGILVDKDSTWTEVTDDELVLPFVITYIQLNTKLIFDPPSGAALESLKNVKDEAQFRIMMVGETGA